MVGCIFLGGAGNGADPSGHVIPFACLWMATLGFDLGSYRPRTSRGLNRLSKMSTSWVTQNLPSPPAARIRVALDLNSPHFRITQKVKARRRNSSISCSALRARSLRASWSRSNRKICRLPSVEDRLRKHRRKKLAGRPTRIAPRSSRFLTDCFQNFAHVVIQAPRGGTCWSGGSQKADDQQANENDRRGMKPGRPFQGNCEQIARAYA